MRLAPHNDSVQVARRSASQTQEQTVQRDGFGVEGVELDLGELAFLDFAPAIDARLGFLNFAAVQAAQELVGMGERSGVAVRGTGEGLDGVAAKKFAPVVMEEIAGSEDVAPGDDAAVGHHHADNSFILQTRSGLRKAVLYFVDEIIDGYADGTGLINFFVRFRASIAGNGRLEFLRRYLSARSSGRRLHVSAVTNGFPNFRLGLINRGALANARMNDGIGSSELRAAGPTAVLDTEDVERERRSADGNDAVLSDNAVLLAAANEFAGEEQKRALAAINENKLVDGSAR